MSEVDHKKNPVAFEPLSPLQMALGDRAPGALPEWVRWLVDAGFESVSHSAEEHRTRRIVIISTPADSPAAGLIALGALIGQLCRSDANEIHSHFDGLVRNARQYVEQCRDCPTKCRPERAGCGFLSGASSRIRVSQTDAPRGILGCGWDAAMGTFIEISERKGSAKLFASSAKGYYNDGSSPYIVATPGRSLSGYLFKAVCPYATILPPNLASAHGGVCLAGRPAGPESTYSAFEACTFSAGGSTQPLSELLTIQAWGRQGVLSRMTYFNPRTQRMDRPGLSPKVVVADGAATLKLVLSRSEFANSDVIAVLPRDVDQNLFEEARDAVCNLRQWYKMEPLHSHFTRTHPKGITGIVLCRNS